MNDSGRHIIRKVAFNFKFNGNSPGLELQEEVTLWCRDVLGPALDSALADFDDPAAYHFINRLQLDIDLESSADWRKELGERLISGLKQNIRSGITGAGSQVLKRSHSESFSVILAHFLKTGTLPWNSRFNSLDGFDGELRIWLGETTSSEIKKLITENATQASMLRLSSIRGMETFILLLSKISDQNSDNLQMIFDDSQRLILSMTDDQQMQELLWKELRISFLEFLTKEIRAEDLQPLFSGWLKRSYELYRVYPGNIDIEQISTEDIRRILKVWKKEIPEILLKNTINKPSPATHSITKASSVQGSSDEMAKELEEGIFISNAGTVIIAPFLPLLFSRTGLSNGPSISDVSAALVLVNYCITGQKEAAEFDLLLPKILCGARPEMVFEMSSHMPVKYFEEADEMLSSAIEYWTALKSTSVQGLQESFLKRSGKLVFKNDEWILNVEQKPYDMLLQQLPWNIGMIRLPWMENLLRTQWILIN